MVFPNATLEAQRVKNALDMGETLQLRTKADLGVVIALSSVYFIDLIAVAFILLNRRYAPIRAKNPFLMTLLFLASVFWCIGDEIVNGHLPLANSTFTDCRSWAILVRVLFGICLMCAIFAIRSYALYYVFKLNRPCRGLGFILPIIFYAGCILAFLIVAYALHPEKSALYVPSLDLCKLDTPFKISIYVFIWITWAFVAFINYKIRNIKSSFNESREMAVACFILLVVMLFNTLVQFIHPYYSFNKGYRISSTLLDHVATNTIWWTIMGSPIINCLFRRKQYLEEWTMKLRQDGLQREYHVRPINCSNATLNMSAGGLRESYMYSASDGQGFFYSDRAEGMWRDEDGLKLTFAEDGDFLLIDSKSKKSSSSAGSKTISWKPSPDAKNELGDLDGRRII
ncbi:hypothetical protein H4R99_003158 [Coemansia sp. RSA 1722]|nr:hypothetical protein LPJ57_003167 [Coemansia sp. RSA 486]KAJ2227617.1 hypothetical protein IWW45_006955 [Coemansia sp. RSA 485]KAJ2600944.1 hypothetical protein H4R99_003158 [Coemansia sp. RSA 1722]